MIPAHMEEVLLTWGIKLQHSSTQGRYLVTDKELKAGDIVFASTPTAYSVVGQKKGRICETCLLSATECDLTSSLQRCSKCKNAYYCSRTCQQKDWKAGHRHECFLHQRIGDQGALSDAILIHRTLCKQKHKETKGPGIHSDVYHHSMDDVNILTTQIQNEEKYAPEIFKSHSMLSEWLYSTMPCFVSNSDQTPLQDTILHLLSMFGTNNFAIMNDLLVANAAAIYPIPALLNHSCTPSCTLSYDRTTQTQYIRALRSLEIGDELTHSYIDVCETRQQRQTTILNEYYFHCNCPKCVYTPIELTHENESSLIWIGLPQSIHETQHTYQERIQQQWATIEDTISKCEQIKCGVAYSDKKYQQQEAQMILSQAEQLELQAETFVDVSSQVLLQQNAKHELELLQKAIDIRSKLFKQYDISLFRANLAAYNAAMLADDTQQALYHNSNILSILQIIFGTIHPLLAIREYSQGDLLKSMGKYEDALTHYKNAHSILLITHAPKSEFVQTLESIVSDTGRV